MGLKVDQTSGPRVDSAVMRCVIVPTREWPEGLPLGGEEAVVPLLLVVEEDEDDGPAAAVGAMVEV